MEFNITNSSNLSTEPLTGQLKITGKDLEITKVHLYLYGMIEGRSKKHAPTDFEKKNSVVKNRDRVARTHDDIIRYHKYFLSVEKIIHQSPYKIGQITLPFSFEIGENNLLPSLNAEDSTDKIQVKYYFLASVSYSMGYYVKLLKKVTLHWHEHKSLFLSPVPLSVIPLERIITTLKQVKVGMWYEDSKSFGKMLKYAAGKDTAAHWFQLNFKAELPNIITIDVTQPFYIQTILKLFVNPSEKPSMALYPDMMISYLKVNLLTRVVLKDKDRPIMVVEAPINFGTFSKLDFKFNSANPTELSSLLSGMQYFRKLKKPLFSQSYPQVSISNELHIYMKVKCVAVDDTKQNSTLVHFNLPIHLKGLKTA